MIKYLALGDSLTVGFGALPTLGFVSRYRMAIQRALARPVAMRESARIGARSADVWRMLRQTPASVVRQADVITITAGGNDLIDAARRCNAGQNTDCLRDALTRSLHQLQRMTAYIESVQTPATPCLIRLVELYNPYPFLPDANTWVERFNRQLRQLENRSIRVARIYDRFLGREHGLIALDGLHPNSRGHAVIARQLAALGYGELESSPRF